MAEKEPPQIVMDDGMQNCHDWSFLPDKSIYPPRPSQHQPTESASAVCAQVDGGDGAFGSYPTEMQKQENATQNAYGQYGWNNAYAQQQQNYAEDNDGDADCNCCQRSGSSGKGIVPNVIAYIIVMGIWLACMFCQMAIFKGIGMTGNWLTCLAYAFLGLPVTVVIFAICSGFVAASQGEDKLLCFPSTFEHQAEHVPMIAITAWIFFFCVGIPISMFTAQEHALKHYLDPTMTQDISCYQNPQKNYEHGKVHFMFLQEREWEWNCSSTGLSESNHSVSTYAMRGRLGTQGNHYFYMSNLFYTGEPKWNCPYPIFAACYFNTGTVQTCEMLKNSTQCWKGPRTGVSYRVMNQNEQFFKNWMNENDSEGEDFIRTKIQRVKYAAPWRNSGPIVTYGGDHPGDFEDKLLSVRKNMLALDICTFVIWSILLLIWCVDPEMVLIVMLIACICH